MPRELLDPNKIFRERDGPDLFGFSPSVMREKIKDGIIPKPKLLAPPPSRARGWYGYVINEHREKVDAEQEAWEAAQTDTKGEGTLRYVPKGGYHPKGSKREAPEAPTPEAPTENPKVAKLKGLKRPARPARRSQRGDEA